MFDFGKSLITMNPDDQKAMLDKAATSQRNALFKVGEDSGSSDRNNASLITICRGSTPSWSGKTRRTTFSANAWRSGRKA